MDDREVTVAWTPADDKAEKFDIYEQSTAAVGFSPVGSTNTNAFVWGGSPDSARVYRVRASAGVATIRPATSDFSNRDLAVNVPFTDVPIDTSVAVKATHVAELRKAVNALCDHVGFARIYDTGTLYTSLLNAPVQASDWSSLQTQINGMRTNPGIGIPPFPFQEVPAPDMPIRKIHLGDLRESVK